MIAAHSEEFASRGKKYQTGLIFSSRPREANFSPKIRRTREETAELPASRGILLSSLLHVCGGLYLNAINKVKRRRSCVEYTSKNGCTIFKIFNQVGLNQNPEKLIFGEYNNNNNFI